MAKAPRRNRCDICLDRRTITLHRHRPIPRLVDTPIEPRASDIASEQATFPCPQCASVEDYDRLMPISASAVLRPDLANDQGYLLYMKRTVCDALARSLIERELIHVENIGDKITASMLVTGPGSTPRFLDRVEQLVKIALARSRQQSS